MTNQDGILKEVWLAFTTLSDAQALIELNNPTKANDEINHAKIHLNEIMSKWSDDDRRDAMSQLECTVAEKFQEFLNLAKGK
tara:strand:+ start:20 stop:265 length:246 start_codon:yes stop_codon:yes gene_type:complete